MNALHTEHHRTQGLAVLCTAQRARVAVAREPMPICAPAAEDPELTAMRYREAKARLELDAIFTERLTE